MVRRRFATHLAALHLLLFCAWSSADTPLVIAELDARRTAAEADADQASAEHELAAWKLTQLLDLRSRGYASWQEVAEQEVSAKSAVAAAQAATQYHEAVLEWQARLTHSNSQRALGESECVWLYMPGSARLVASIPTDIATRALSKRHLENLRSESQSIAEIDLSALEASVKKAQREIDYRRTEDNAELLNGAVLSLRLAAAKVESAKARKAEAAIITRRMALISASLDKGQAESEEPSPAIAQLGTPFVDATSDADLDRLAVAMATDNFAANKQIAWLQLQRDVVSDKIDSLKKLSDHLGGDQRELEEANKKKTDLEQQIVHAQDLLKLRKQIASEHPRTSNASTTESVESAELSPLDLARYADANVVRHFLELKQLKLKRESKLAAVQAQRGYLVERCRRVELIPEDARPPKELGDLRRKVQGAEIQLAIVEADLALLDHEQQRFCRQVESQRGDQYQLVQTDHGRFIGRDQFEVGASLIATVGFVGAQGVSPKLPTIYPYIESPTIIQCMTDDLVQGLDPAIQIDAGPADELHQDDSDQDDASQGETHLTSFGWRLTTDGFAFSPNRFCYRPFSLRAEYLQYRWAASHHWRSVRLYRRRSFSSYEPYSYNFWWHSPSWYRVYRPARLDSCGGDYWNRSAYPSWSRIYSRPLSNYQGLRYSSGLGCGCFD
jgi:hypothetical protein